jgi:hypothetical protein
VRFISEVFVALVRYLNSYWGMTTAEAILFEVPVASPVPAVAALLFIKRGVSHWLFSE